MTLDEFTKELRDHLLEIEQAWEELRAIQSKHKLVFARVDVLHDRLEILRERLKRTAYVNRLDQNVGLGANPDNLSFFNHEVAGKDHLLNIIYRRRPDHYDPRELPPEVLSRWGVVAEVDAIAIESLEDKRCERALVRGSWMIPMISLEKAQKRKQ
jgi:hypothetical protein